MAGETGGIRAGRTGGVNPLDPQSGGDNPLAGHSLKDLLEKLVAAQQQQPQQAGGSQPSGGGGPQAANGAKGAQQGGDSQFSLEELLKELQRRQEQQGQREFANSMRKVNAGQQVAGGQNQNQPSGNFAAQLVAAAPIDLSNNLNIGGGGAGFSGGGGGSFA